MKRFIEGVDREQSTLLPECLDDWIDDSNRVRAVDVFVGRLNLVKLGFDGVVPEATGRPSYHPLALLKLYIYGSLNRVQSSRRLEREAGRNLEVIWLLRRLTPDDKTIADFRKDNGPAIKKVCARFVVLCRQVGLITSASVSIDGRDRQASVRHDEGAHGCDPLPHEASAKSCDRNGAARARLQSHARAEHPRCQAFDLGDEGLRRPACCAGFSIFEAPHDAAFANHSCLEDQDRKNMLEPGVVRTPARSRLADTPSSALSRSQDP